MGTLTGMNIADRAWTKANEATAGAATRWTSAEALMWLNDAQRAIVVQLPRANTVRATPTVVAGTRQTLAGLGLTTGIGISDISANYNAAGTVRGRAIVKSEKAYFDDALPGWHAETATEAKHWFYDDTDPLAFYIWPAITGASGKLEIIYPALPTDLAAIGNTISLGDEYAEAMQMYLLYSFFSKDATYAKSPQLATTYYGMFQGLLGIRGKNLAGGDSATDAKALGA